MIHMLLQTGNAALSQRGRPSGGANPQERQVIPKKNPDFIRLAEPGMKRSAHPDSAGLSIAGNGGFLL